MKRPTLHVLAVILCTICIGVLTSHAQNARTTTTNIVDFGLDHESDSIFLAKINAKMDSIRQHRPTVAVVLCGGGAKGAAHVGFLRYLEELDIPIDMVLGTSMGGLVGGIYAMGYPVDQLDSLVKNQDWAFIMSDKVPKKYIPYRVKQNKKRFLISIPFHYRKSDYDATTKTDRRYLKNDNLKLRVDDDQFAPTTESNLVTSLPAGYLVGENINNLFSSITVGYHDSTDFSALPIPFVCVAADMVTLRTKYWHTGKMPTALRSTMSIPGLFAPVRTEGLVLTDGGVRNNFPVSAAKAMGADIVIGMAFASSEKEFGNVTNISDVLLSHMNMLTRDSYQYNASMADVVVIPDLKNYGMMSFDTTAINYIVKAGYDATVAKRDTLLRIKERIGGEGLRKGPSRVVDISRQKVLVDDVEFEGFTPEEATFIKKRIADVKGEMVGKDDLNNIMYTIFGTDIFESVNYELLGEEAPYRLRIRARKAPIHKLGLGAKLDTEEAVSLYLNLGLGTNTLTGSSLDITSRICLNPILDVHYKYTPRRGLSFNIRQRHRWTDWSDLDFDSVKDMFNMSFWSNRLEVYMSSSNLLRNDIQVGIRNEYMKTKGYFIDELADYYVDDEKKHDYLSAFLRHDFYTLDDPYFPTRGLSYEIEYDYLISPEKHPLADRQIYILQGNITKPISMGSRFVVQPHLYGRFIIADEIPLLYANVAGGFTPGRYIEQQVPIESIRYAVFRGKNMGVAAVDLRMETFRQHYATLRGEMVFDSRKTLSHYNGGYGFVGSYALNTILGPISGNIGWFNEIGFSYYLSIGFDF